MSTSSDDQPTKVLPQTTAEPPAHAAPATRRSPGWPSSVPAHIGRFRTSSLVLGGLFVVLFVLNLVLPRPDSGTRTITTSDGEILEVPCTVVECDEPTTPPTPETPVPVVPTSPVPPDDEEDEEPVSTPSRTTTPRTPTPTPTPTRTPSPTSETTEQETEQETTDSEPTGTTEVETTADPTD